MAFTVTSRGTNEQNYSTSNTVASFTPTADSLLLLSFFTSDVGVDPTSITGHGTWVKVGSHLTVNNGSLVVYGCIASSTPSASTVVVNYAYTGNTEAGIIEIDGADTSSTVSNAIVQDAGGLAQYNSGGGPYTLSETLSAFTSTANLAVILGASPNNAAMSAEAGYTEHYNTTTNFRIVASTKVGEDLNPTLESSSSYAHMGIKAYEIKEASAGGGNTVTSGPIPYLPVAGQTYTDLSSPVNTAGTLGETYAGSPAATGDQWVYDTNLTGDASITLTVDAQGYWLLSGSPSVTSTASFYRIDSTGTVDVEDTVIFTVGGPISGKTIASEIVTSIVSNIYKEV